MHSRATHSRAPHSKATHSKPLPRSLKLLRLVAVAAAAVIVASLAFTATPAFAASAPTITQQPVGGTVVEGETIQLSVAVTGDPTPTVTWQIWSTRDGWVDTSRIGLTTDVKPYFTVYYRAKVSNSGATIYSDSVTLTVVAPRLTITENPSNTSAIEGGTAMFKAMAATNTRAADVVWQTGSGMSWSNIPGATSPILILDK